MVPRFFPRVEAKRLVDAVAVLAKRNPEKLRVHYHGVLEWSVAIGDPNKKADVVVMRKELPFWQRRRLLRIARAATLKTKTGLIQ